ncbi:hypothetical protein D3C81_2221810 [compost metagenome]
MVGTLSQVEQVIRRALAVFMGASEAALDLQCLCLALGLQIEARRFGQHVCTGLLDSLVTGAGLVEREADE